MTRCLVSSALALFVLAACDRPETRIPVNAATAAQNVNETEMLRRKIAQMEEENKLREQYITEVTQTLAAVQDNLTKLRVAQNDVQRQWSSIERQRVTASQRDELLQRIEALRGELESNDDRLAAVKRRAESAEGRVSQLLPLISQLQKDLVQRGHEIASLRTTVSRLQIEIRRRDEVIDTQVAAISQRDRALDERERQLAAADVEKNLVYYRIDTIAALHQEKLIIREGGLFGSRLRGVWVPADKLEPTEFNPIDRRELRELAVNAPMTRVQIVTHHDPQSFTQEPLTPTTSIICILDPEKFWAAGRFLIVARK
jgi:septal ring factor EnvC (AmiA/AmiB activator)